ncbi:EKC/KEOPS complex subunit LAGE3-like [Artibeus jamaicensis]|uniref:EKC/KEOPS complex subunit LAGE3-like n=1 Tax=Artibeus jamaicensis TaxID=9417 RepID=UPI00187BCEB6|nr:EKC/KEOPS complex subunit LAGE3-like [Artibeus jamaicensis]
MQEFTLTVPFLSDVDAEVALRFLMPGAELYCGKVLWELSVTGRDLFIRLTAEDSELLQISTYSLLIQLLIVVQIMQNIVPPAFANFEPKRGD